MRSRRRSIVRCPPASATPRRPVGVRRARRRRDAPSNCRTRCLGKSRSTVRRSLNALVSDVREVRCALGSAGLTLGVVGPAYLRTFGDRDLAPSLRSPRRSPGCGKTTLIDWLSGRGAPSARSRQHFRFRHFPHDRAGAADAPGRRSGYALARERGAAGDAQFWPSLWRLGHSHGGDDFEPRCFSTWGACAIALIGKLPATLESRSIEIALRRKMRSEVVLRWRSGRAEAAVLARQARRWAIDNAESLKGADPDLPEQLFNRTADNWRPLIAIADRLGADWPGRARIAAEELSGFAESQSGSLGIELLADIREAFARREFDRFASESLIAELIARSREGLGRVRPLPQADHATPARPASEALRNRAEEYPDA